MLSSATCPQSCMFIIQKFSVIFYYLCPITWCYHIHCTKNRWMFHLYSQTMKLNNPTYELHQLSIAIIIQLTKPIILTQISKGHQIFENSKNEILDDLYHLVSHALIFFFFFQLEYQKPLFTILIKLPTYIPRNFLHN